MNRAPRPSHYAVQLSLLADTYRLIRDFDLRVLAGALAAARQRQAIYVGSGGALGVARLAAELHEIRTRGFARAATPLELIGMPPLSDHAVVLFSAGARHPDAALAAAAAERSGAHPVFLVTHRAASELTGIFSDDVRVVTLPGLSGREGFLATNSVLAMAAAAVAASGFKLPSRLPNIKPAAVEPLRDQTIILGGPGLGAVATDLETRLSETGLSTAQVTDYRNFAHGRHTGLARRLDQTTIVALIEPELSRLAERTLAILPEAAHVVRLESRLNWPLSTVDLLVASMNAIAGTAVASDLDPGRPRVPRFGRQLYRLSSRSLISPGAGPADRKLSALRIGGPHKLRRRYERAADVWVSELRTKRFHGFVFDYDGTVCATNERYELPDATIQDELLRLLREGAVLGFASGRGGSLHRDLRAWVPKQAWPQVQLGLYNGGLSLRLSQPLDVRREPSRAIAEALRRMRVSPLTSYIELAERGHQLAMSPREDSGLTLDAIMQAAQEIILTPPAQPLKATASAHSIDVIPADTAKTQTVQRVCTEVDGEVMAFGDQGQVGGNDFELLAATRWSLSVDRVSSDPTRCWNLDERGERGPELLRRYLRSLQRMRDGFAFRPLVR